MWSLCVCTHIYKYFGLQNKKSVPFAITQTMVCHYAMENLQDIKINHILYKNPKEVTFIKTKCWLTETEILLSVFSRYSKEKLHIK